MKSRARPRPARYPDGMGTVVFSQLGSRRGPSIIAALAAAALGVALLLPRPGAAPDRSAAPVLTSTRCGQVAARPAPPPSDDERCRAALAERAAWRVRQAEAAATGMTGELEPGPGWEPAVNNCLARR